MMNDAMLLILPGRRKKINQTPDHQSVILEWAALKILPSSGLTKSTQSYATPPTPDANHDTSTATRPPRNTQISKNI